MAGRYYKPDEVEAIANALGDVDLHYFPDVQILEGYIFSYKHRVGRAKKAPSKTQVAKVDFERARILKLVRDTIHITERAAAVAAKVDQIVVEGEWQVSTRLLAQAMFDGAINSNELQSVIVSRYLEDPQQLNWRNAENWGYADSRKKEHRFEYLKWLVVFWAEEKGIRPDEVRVSTSQPANGKGLMNFIVAAATRPLKEAGELVDIEMLLKIVLEIKAYWRGRPWIDPELETEMEEERNAER
jgi:hypothetical protein